ncbi:LacI family DNA-binding transcriptional regulator [Bifidobacterium sp. SO4]|uniref:LacI family DNA-binding transcriptional regulator n=1 Tax=Bifidobacterium sp. SO4 TaxID=2809030 RepID=UPI001BDD043A|nr:LacI family DNA-binding transcriptional regulator [Bifidobacterium sp. SO4]MBT1170645.1 LacI family DNA-binding transcriptional regulator [Bifidobacterium sp. SO4]
MITMKDIANATGVSVVTVSNALRGKDNVSPETAQRILETADSMGYRVNAANLAARNLRVRGTRNALPEKPVIGVAIFEFDNMQPAQLAAEISRTASARRCQTLFQQTLTDAENEHSIIDNIANQFCDGLILSSANLPVKDIIRFTKRRPTVLVDDDRPQEQLDTVLSPCEIGSAEAVRYLLDKGHRRIGFVGDGFGVMDDPMRLHSVGGRRMRGCADALSGAGMALTTGQCIDTEWTWEGARSAIHQIGESIRGYDALFCLTDNIALGVIRGLGDLGIRVPDDIAVMGFDGCAIGECFMPGLTTVAVDIPQMASLAVDSVLDRIEGRIGVNEHGRRRIVGHHLEIRESA